MGSTRIDAIQLFESHISQAVQLGTLPMSAIKARIRLRRFVAWQSAQSFKRGHA